MTDNSNFDSADKSESRNRFLSPERRTHIRSASAKITSMYLGFAAAAFLTLTYYPGAFYYDVIRQFNWVISISASLRHGAAELPNDFISWWPIWNTFFRVPFYILTNEPGFILFISIVFFFWSARELCRNLQAELAWLPFIFLCTFTPIAAWIVLHGPHTILAACLLLAISRYLAGRYLSASLFAAVGVLFRPEAVLVALALPSGLALAGKVKLGKALVAGLIAVLGFSLSTWSYPNPSSAEHTSAEGLAVLTLTILSQKPSAFEEDETLSSLFKHVPPYDLQCSLTVYCPANIESTHYNAVHRPGSLSTLVKANLRLLAKEPRLYAGTVMKRISLASLQRLAVVELGRTDWLHLARTEVIRNYMTLNMADLVQRHQNFYVSPFGAFYIPVVFILVMVLGGLILRRVDIIVIILACAIIYVPKTVILPDQEIRYYFFELMLSLLIALISVNTLATRLAGTRSRDRIVDSADLSSVRRLE
jgi:hypothetical protein